MKSNISPCSCLHIKLNVFGDNSVKGWWVYNKFPKIPKYVVVEANTITTSRVDSEVSFLIEHGAKNVHVFTNN